MPARIELSPGTRRWLAITLIAFVALCAWRLGAPRPPDRTTPMETVLRGATMGTTYSVKIAEDLDALATRAAGESVAGTLEAIERVASTYRDDSELARFNAHRATDTPVAPSRDLARMFRIALDVGQRSGGALDVTVGPIVNAWGFGPDDSQMPTEAHLSTLKARVGLDKLALRDDGLFKAHPDLTCDLSSIAKGYAVDRVAEALESLGYRDFLVEVGGELRARGRRSDGHPFRVGVERPLVGRREVAQVVELVDLGMATSGDYRNFREHNGKRLAHLIDPRTARPVEHALASVTVLHAQSAYADAWATALSVLGPDRGPQVANREGLAALFILRKGKDRFEPVETPAFARRTRANLP